MRMAYDYILVECSLLRAV